MHLLRISFQFFNMTNFINIFDETCFFKFFEIFCRFLGFASLKSQETSSSVQKKVNL